MFLFAAPNSIYGLHRLRSESPQSRSEGQFSFGDKVDHGISQGGEELRRGTAANPAIVLPHADITAIMQAVLDAPVSAREIKKPPGVRLVAIQARDSVNRLGGFLPVDSSFSCQAKNLLDAGPIQVRV